MAAVYAWWHEVVLAHDVTGRWSGGKHVYSCSCGKRWYR